MPKIQCVSNKTSAHVVLGILFIHTYTGSASARALRLRMVHTMKITFMGTVVALLETKMPTKTTPVVA